MQTYLDFEKKFAETEKRIAELKGLSSHGDELESQEGAVGRSDNIQSEINKLEKNAAEILKDIYAKLTPWQRTQIARHPDRPHLTYYINHLFDEFTPLAGDRKFAEDHAIIGGLARFCGRPVMLIGQEKGFDTESRLNHNFGMARPEGYRKAVRLMEMASRFGLPVINFIDTAGAYPGIGAEERGQAEAIARSIDCCLGVETPLIACVLGEGGSGGAVAIATANHVVMLENAIYTVASPEASASILWRDASRAKDAANNMRITSSDLLSFGVVDTIVEEPAGGAHRHAEEMANRTRTALLNALKALETKSPQELKADRAQKYLAMTRKLK